mgnify:CR=1 FL=1
MNNDKATPKHKTAVALEYDGERAPRLSAKGNGLTGDRIVQLAYENDIPVHEDTALVQALSSIELGDEIPENLYLAVAEILAFIYFLEEKDTK